MLLLWIGAGVALVFFSSKEPEPGVSSPETFWPGKTFVSENGYLITENYLPLRALARKPNVRLYPDPKRSADASKVIAMQPWSPYYVYDFAPGFGTMEIGLENSTEKKWVAYDDCFCWPTRECMTIEQPIDLYSNMDNAKRGSAFETEYIYKFTEHFLIKSSLSEETDLHMIPSLPVIARKESIYWCIMRPEGDESGYGKCWVKVESSDMGVDFRIRTSREEFDKYLGDLYRLIRVFRNRARSHDTANDIAQLFVSFYSFGSKSESSGHSGVRLQVKGILKPTGGIQDFLQHKWNLLV